MTVKELIRKTDALKPNAYSDYQKTEWLNECEGIVQTEVFLRDIDDVTEYNFDEDQDTELLVRFPHNKLYSYYLQAMIDYTNGETGKYSNSMAMFNSCLNEFVIWFARVYNPANNPGIETEYLETNMEGDD